MPSAEPADAWRPPRRRDALAFWLKTRLLSVQRLLQDALRPDARRWRAGSQWADAPVLAQVRSPLWTDGRPDEFALVAGKVQNLRVALPAFDTVEVPPGQVLSFWRQLGRPSGARGFVLGREVREGCVVPTLAGGICQLSNALAEAARRAGFELVERHGHSARVEQATDSAGMLDATVFWRHIDLQLRAAHSWRLELALQPDELVLTLRGHAVPRAQTFPIVPTQHAAESAVARGCLSCNETQCFRHRAHHAAPAQGRSAYLLDGWSPEFVPLLQEPGDRFVPVPLRLAFWRGRPAGWPTDGATNRAWWASLRRSLWLRLWSRHGGGRRQASLLNGQQWLAHAYARALRPLHTRLIVDQGLLAHLELLGTLGGRELIVLASSLPMAEIQLRLDAATRRWPMDASLRDFRAPPELVAAEQKALARASRVVTSHAEVATVLKERYGPIVELHAWYEPKRQDSNRPTPTEPPLLVFPASDLSRKGARELAAVLQDVPACRVRLLGEVTDPSIWHGVKLEVAPRGSTDPFADAVAVVLPAHIEHSPRLLLRALSAGLPVIATPACGLGERAGLITVPAGDVEALRAALRALLNG